MKQSLFSRLLLLTTIPLALLFAFGKGAAAAETASAAKLFEVQTVRDIAYYEGTDVDPVKHKLDLFLPKGQKDFPVLFFVHGGAWMHGDKSFLGVYSTLGTFFARHGIGTVVTNYRLSPGVMHPEHIKDVARAFAWTYRNIARYGGKPDQVFASGHSAGAHLVSLLATDATYLKAEGLTREVVKGVMPISGVYTIPERLFASVFGKDPEARKQAAPLSHVQADLPPFLILYADKDFPSIDKMSEDFYKCLKDKACEAQLLEVKKRNHLGIILNACVEDDPVAVAMLDFIAKHTGKEKAEGAKP